jgi:ferric-dicitrate binding protein FerR (iron transport regulator)
MFWKTKTLNFDKTNLKEVFTIIEKYYNVEIIYNNINVEQVELSTSFSNIEIEDIIKVICASFDFDYTRSDGQFIIKNNETD